MLIKKMKIKKLVVISFLLSIFAYGSIADIFAEENDGITATISNTDNNTVVESLSEKKVNNSAIYNNTFLDNPTEPQNNAGLESSLKLVATNKDNQSEETSSNVSDKTNANNKDLNDGGQSSRVSNYADIINADKAENLKEVAVFKNTTTSDLKFSSTIDFPLSWNPKTDIKANVPVLSGTDINSIFDFGGNDSSSFKFLYSLFGENGSNTVEGWGNKFDISKLLSMSISGTLKPDTYLKVSVPLDISNVELENKNTIRISKRIFSPEKASRLDLYAILNKPLYYVDDMIYGKYAGAYRVTENGKNIYSAVPEKIQKLLPDVEKDDLIYNMFDSMYREGNQANLSVTSDDVAFNSSMFLIKTERIFNAVKDNGYTVYADDIRGLWNSYAYTMTSGLVFTDSNGEPVKLGEKNSDGILLSPYYVELHKIFDTKDIEIFVGDNWDKFDNLTYRKGIIPRGSNSATDLTDDQIVVEHNVDNKKVGVYNVKYLYEVSTGKFVTITAKVTVKNRPNPDKPTPPNIPEIDDKPVVPNNPTTPDKPVIPDEPMIPDKPVIPNKPMIPDKPKTPDNPAIPSKNIISNKPVVLNNTLPQMGSEIKIVNNIIGGIFAITSFAVARTNRRRGN
ncbi:MAG: hypothetical protein SO435_02525 [Peptostreptococcus porci]|nr:hypothetical protein [Peptostreptococcus porci]